MSSTPRSAVFCYTLNVHPVSPLGGCGSAPRTDGHSELERLRDQLLSDLVLRFIVSWGLWRINTGRPMRITTLPTTH